MGRVSRLIGMAERMGRRKGLLGRSSTWLGVWVAAAGYRKLHDFFSEEPEIIREEIGPGQQLVITHYVKGEEPPEPVKLSRRQRRKSEKVATKAQKAEKQTRRADKRARRSTRTSRSRDEAADVGTVVTDIDE